MTCEEFRLLMTARLDGELGEEEILRVETHRNACSACREEMEAHRHLKILTSQLHFREPENLHWQEYWQKLYHRLERHMGWFLLVAGGCLLLSYLLVFLVESFFFQQGIPWPLRWGILFMLTGFMLLLLSVVRERLFLRKFDKYEGILR